MTPMEYRQGGRGVEITYGAARTALGLMMVGATDRGLCFVSPATPSRRCSTRFANSIPPPRRRPLPRRPPWRSPGAAPGSVGRPGLAASARPA